MTKIDLFLGSDIGLWSLEQVAHESIRRVFTFDSTIAKMATQYGIEVIPKNANLMLFDPSDIGFSIHYPRIFHPPLLKKYQKIFNLHPGYLPWGRGYYPVFWAIWEQTPAGATLHEINERIDEGAIVAQQKVEQFPYDTGGSLFERVREAEKELFIEFWPKILAGDELPSQLQHDIGTYHSKKEFYEIKRNCNWKELDGKSLIRLIRALSFSGYTGLEIRLGDRPFDVHLNNMMPYEEGGK